MHWICSQSALAFNFASFSAGKRNEAASAGGHRSTPATVDFRRSCAAMSQSVGAPSAGMALTKSASSGMDKHMKPVLEATPGLTTGRSSITPSSVGVFGSSPVFDVNGTTTLPLRATLLLQPDLRRLSRVASSSSTCWTRLGAIKLCPRSTVASISFVGATPWNAFVLCNGSPSLSEPPPLVGSAADIDLTCKEPSGIATSDLL
mmetsp:Transcript_9969/g.22257  ORF Transcript_9969/g.22257 Transcript_9969/m.22257 type:complete len:204 (-) Transcript_9969:1287-1898(-)